MTKFKKVLFGFFGVYLLAAIFPVFCSANAENPGTDGSSQQWHSLPRQPVSPEARRGGQVGGQRIEEIYSQLNLTDLQKKQLEANKQQHRAKMQIARQAMKTDRQAFQQELMKPQLDMSRITALHNQIKALQSQMEDNRLNSILGVRTILTPEQFSKFVNLMHKRKQEHDEGPSEH